VNRKLYIHELIEIKGHNRARYMHHMTANWCPVARRERHMSCFGVWATVGSTGAWPQTVNMWELNGWKGLAANFEHELVGHGAQDPSLAEWWSVASELRSGGFDRIVAPERWSPTIDELTKAQEIWPNSASIRQAMLGVHAYYGDPKRAEQLLSTSSSDEEALARLRVFLRARESPTEANIAATIAGSKAVAEANPVAADQYVGALAMFGTPDDVFRVLADQNYRRFIDTSTLFLPEFKRVRADPRFMAIAAEFGLVRYWTVSGHWPDFCSAPGIAYKCVSEARKYLPRT